MRVSVLGASIVGLTTAYELTRAGHDVTVIARPAVGRCPAGQTAAQYAGCSMSA